MNAERNTLALKCAHRYHFRKKKAVNYLDRDAYCKKKVNKHK